MICKLSSFLSYNNLKNRSTNNQTKSKNVVAFFMLGGVGDFVSIEIYICIYKAGQTEYHAWLKC